MKILIDMNLAPRWVQFFLNVDLQATHWSEVGKGNAPDHEIFEYARKHAYIVFTNDLDFGAILAASHLNKPSVIQIRADDTRPEVVGTMVLSALWQVKDELAQGALVTIEPSRTRLRILPLT